jgi:glutathione S-transferase
MATAKKAKRATKKKAARKAAKPRRLTATAKIKAAAKKSAARAKRGQGAKAARAASAARAKPRSDTVTLHGLYLSLPSCKVGLALSMMGVPFEYRHVNLQGGEHKQPAFLAMNRWGQVPVLEHRGMALAQSNAILQYLAETFGKFAGRTPQERIRVAEWLQWDQDRMANIGMVRVFTKFFPETHEAVVKFARARGEQALDTLDRHLGTSKFLAGPAPTIADIAIFPWVATAEEGGFDITRWPNVQAWAERMLKQPGAAHPYAIMPKEHRPAA